jgi:hypothetical protein
MPSLTGARFSPNIRRENNQNGYPVLELSRAGANENFLPAISVIFSTGKNGYKVKKGKQQAKEDIKASRQS